MTIAPKLRRSTLWSLLLIPGGLSLAHAIGYWATHQSGHDPSLSGGHVHIDALAAVALPFALPVLVRAYVSGRRRELAPARFRPLVAQLVILYLLAEVVEHLIRGVDITTTLTEASLVLGVLAQILVAAVFSAGLRTVAAVGRAVRPARRRGQGSAVHVPVPTPPATPITKALVTLSSVSRRGPPQLLLT